MVRIIIESLVIMFTILYIFSLIVSIGLVYKYNKLPKLIEHKKLRLAPNPSKWEVIWSKIKSYSTSISIVVLSVSQWLLSQISNTNPATLQELQAFNWSSIVSSSVALKIMSFLSLAILIVHIINQNRTANIITK